MEAQGEKERKKRARLKVEKKKIPRMDKGAKNVAVLLAKLGLTLT